MRVTIYTDGASRGNPGPGGYGSVLLYTDPRGELHTLELSEGYAMTTNNRMELMGVISALEALKRPCEVDIYSDSQYVVKANEENWVAGWKMRGWRTTNKQPVKNKDLWERLLQASEPHVIHYFWVKGHDGDLYNERCDELATNAADGENLLEDVGFEENNEQSVLEF
ncbi:MAG: ribonuclease HI [Coriobacteriales bacterium]|nr:ribonuclease HI [Coriobacteriales bacterium]